MKQKGTSPRTIFLCLFAVLLFGYVYVHQERFDGPTSVSRLDVLHSLVKQRVFWIDGYHTNTPDKALFRGHYYSDKAPGTVVLALPGFALAAAGLAVSGVDLDSTAGWLISSWVACAVSLGMLTAFGGVALFAWLSNYVSPRWALVATLALFLGAAPLPYTMALFSHAAVAGLLAIALWALGRPEKTPASGTAQPGKLSAMNWRDPLAGFACGWALACEYTAGIAVGGVLAWVISLGWRRAVVFCIAAIPPLLLIPAYSLACFGDAFVLPYSLGSYPQMREGLYSIQWPNANTAWNILFSPARGLFFWTPFLAMAGFGYPALFKRSRRLFWLTLGVPLLHIIVMSGRSWDWAAGPTFGARYLTPVLPFLALPCALGIRRYPFLGFAAAYYSVLITTVASVTTACVTLAESSNPLFELQIPLLLKGEFSPNLGMAAGLPPHISIVVYYAVLAAVTVWLWRHLPEPDKPGETISHGSPN